MNHVLLDSHILLWLVEPGSKRLSARAKDLISNAATVHFSIVSFWEIGIKAAKGNMDVDLRLLSTAVDQAALHELPLKRQHIQTLSRFAVHHRDPFDRMLIAQAVTEPLHLLTVDKALAAYSDLVTLV
jgi:PIN domain nuclease of toxin-antitoxin system